MPRKIVKQKRIGKDVPITLGMEILSYRTKALEVLALAKKQEAERVANGYRYVRDGKTRRLIKVVTH